MTIAIGKLRHRIQLQTQARTAGGSQTMDQAYSTFATVWGNLDPFAAPRKLQGKVDEDLGTVTHRATIRYRADVASSQYIWYDERRFEIRTVRIVEEKNKFLELLLSERGVAIAP